MTEVSHLEVKNPSGGRPRHDYHLTLDAGKHVGMMSGTEKGYEIREYFLACERKAKDAQTQLQGMVATLQTVAYEAGRRGARDAIEEVLPALIEQGMLKKHGGYVDGWTAGDVIKEVLEDRKGSKGLPRWVSNRLVRFHAQKSAAVRIAHLGSKSAYIFDPAVCKEWLAMGGKKAILLFMEKRRDRERGMFKLVPTEAS